MPIRMVIWSRGVQYVLHVPQARIDAWRLGRGGRGGGGRTVGSAHQIARWGRDQTRVWRLPRFLQGQGVKRRLPGEGSQALGDPSGPPAKVIVIGDDDDHDSQENENHQSDGKGGDERDGKSDLDRAIAETLSKVKGVRR